MGIETALIISAIASTTAGAISAHDQQKSADKAAEAVRMEGVESDIEKRKIDMATKPDEGAIEGIEFGVDSELSGGVGDFLVDKKKTSNISGVATTGGSGLGFEL